ncbi:MAG: type IV secretion system DNA-binding domain-containing protein [Pseudomonadota bacterium]
MARDIRTSKDAVSLEHASARGKVVRNGGNFTRGSQLFHHQVLMTWAGVRIPLFVWGFATLFFMSVFAAFYFREHEIQLVLMRSFSLLWIWIGLVPDKEVHLTLPSGRVVVGLMVNVPHHPDVIEAWDTAKRIVLASFFASTFLCLPAALWFVDYSRRKGDAIMQERHERGSLLIDKAIVHKAIIRHNTTEHEKELARRNPPLEPRKVLTMSLEERARAGLHVPYYLAGMPFPWRLEQSHTMLIGSTGTGKTTELKKLVVQARVRGHMCVIFDLTGSFVESFYRPETDIILNPMDQRCKPWSIFNDCENYAEFMSAAAALIPPGSGGEDEFWQKGARTLFVEMCQEMLSDGVRSNGGLAHYLMSADLSEISRRLENTVAASLVPAAAPRMAESVRATFTANANVMRFLPEPEQGEDGFSINRWMAEKAQAGSCLFITSSHPDLVLNRPLLTLWMDLAVNALFRMGRTRDLRCWFLLDEVHTLHRLPAIEHGLQTARGVGGAFVLGMHSFDKLAETYGEHGAVNLASLARTKLVLGTGDPETAQRCADFIGSRQVRKTDEAYSYGYNNTRDASTISSRSDVEPLVFPSDIGDLQSLQGIIKFPDGFPATKVAIEWMDHPQIAEGFERVTTMRAAPYTPPNEEDAEGEGESRDREGREGEQSQEVAIEESEKSEVEKEADALRAEIEKARDRVDDKDAKPPAKKAKDDRTEEGKRFDERTRGQRRSSAKLSDLRSPERAGRDKATSDLGKLPGSKKGAPKVGRETPKSDREGPQDSAALRDEKRGFGTERRDDGPSLDDDFGLGQ